MLFASLQLGAQGCCPPPGSCNPCSGGINVLTLRYHGFVTARVTVDDNGSPELFDEWVQPGGTFTVRARASGNFVGNHIYLVLNNLPFTEVPIRVTCGLEFDPSTYIGLFTIVSAESKNGGILCCTSNSGSVLPPEISGCPANITASATTGCNAIVVWNAPTAAQCDVISLTTTHAPGSSFPIGTTTVTYTAKNSANLTSTCVFTVNVSDGAKPTVTSATPNVTVNAGNDCKAVATWTAPQFADNCAVSTVTSTHTSGSVFPMGSTTVTYTAKDAAGNPQTSKFTVTVKDATPPVVTACPPDITVQTATGCSATATWTAPSFTDGCSAVTVTSSHKPGAQFSAGITTVKYTATDAAGNATPCSFNVIVKDNSVPEFVSCPTDTTISTTAIGSVPYHWIPPVATDPCSIPDLSSNYQPGDHFPVGLTTVVYTAKDVSGNSSTCSFVVSVKQEDTKLDVAQLLTPDGNATNDSWIIGNIELYKDNRVTIVDRWGSVVYSVSGYDNESRVWTGRNAQGAVVPSGTYFYTISVRSGNESSESRGFIEVLR